MPSSAHHGDYRRLTPAGKLVKRYLCPREGRTINLLPVHPFHRCHSRSLCDLERSPCGSPRPGRHPQLGLPGAGNGPRFPSEHQDVAGTGCGTAGVGPEVGT